MTRIAILGATGYTALELIKILLRHPEAEIVAVTSRQEGQPPIAMIHPIADRPGRFAAGGPQPGRGGRAGRMRLQLPAARRQRGGRPAVARRRQPGRRFQRRLSLERSGSLRPMVRPETRRSRSGWARSSTDCRSCSASRFRPRSWWPIRAAIRPPRFWRWRRC